MELYKLTHFDTDSYTYGSDLTVGIYSTFELAEAAIPRYLKDMELKGELRRDGNYWRWYLSENTYLEIEIFSVDEDWF
jgi:hypothetical protein